MKKEWAALCFAVSLASGQIQSATIAEQLIDMSDEQSQGGSLTTNKTIQVIAEPLSDASALQYVGGEVAKTKINNYLVQLKALLGNEFAVFRQKQVERDHGKFHITLVNPFELKEVKPSLIQKLLNDKTPLSFQLKGLGRVKNENGKAYFIVAESRQAQSIRAKLGLKPKDFHITLGFSPKDIHGVRKDKTTLIY
ncbi:hypothetical protein HII17_07310 [Thalassotalea sp. M1531]|uniref:Swiss Army Knife 2H phosphoesterase domain-containing protein n=1 Tax=Thalassotalea algicola TaxID=2716224 RepID=A0A7Y0LB96_9GAMM|nr:hypothetical protein [Thalassotalea algicola]NMP31365.1 hypothetical protein [Thalassotalea algicola]